MKAILTYVLYVSRLILRYFPNFRYPFALLLLRFFHIEEKGIDSLKKSVAVVSRRASAGFLNFARTTARGRERERDREKYHFIKNKFRKGVDGYPGASRGFDARRLASSFSLALPLAP